jgi:hypothetical protein
MEVVLSVFRLVIGAVLFFLIPSFVLTVLLFPRKQDLYGLQRALIAVITSFLVSMADATLVLITVTLNVATLALTVFVVSAVFVVLVYMRWMGVGRSERLASSRSFCVSTDSNGNDLPFSYRQWCVAPVIPPAERSQLRRFFAELSLAFRTFQII